MGSQPIAAHSPNACIMVSSLQVTKASIKASKRVKLLGQEHSRPRTTPAHQHTKNTTTVKTTSPSLNHHHTINPAHVLSNSRWISCHKNMGYHATDPKIRTQGAERGRSWIAMKHGDESLKSSNAQHTAERDAELYPGLGPSWWGKTPTSCLLVLRRDTSRGVQGLGYRALAGRR
jgi:hypothetical protein